RSAHRVALQRRAELAQGRQQAAIEVAVLGERGVERRNAVALREDEAIALGRVRGLRVLAQVIAIERLDQIDGAQRATGMTAPRLRDHLEDVDAEARAYLAQRLDSFFAARLGHRMCPPRAGAM